MNKMKKTIIIAVILIFSGIIALGVSLICAKGDLENYVFADQRYEQKGYTAKSEIGEIRISELSQDVTVRAGNVDKITVSYYENGVDNFEISESDGTLTLSRVRHKIDLNLNFLIDDDTDTLVLVPRDFGGRIFVECESADVDVYGVSPEKLSVKTQSGEASLENVSSEELYIETHSGETELEGISGNSITLVSQSGDIEGEIAGYKSDYKIKVDVSSGDCNLRDTDEGEKSLNINTKSGDVEIDFIG